MTKMSNKEPLISIIIVSHNGRFKELKKVLNYLSLQTYKKLEIIIVGNNISEFMDTFLNSWQKEDNFNKYINFNENIMSYFGSIVTSYHQRKITQK